MKVYVGPICSYCMKFLFTWQQGISVDPCKYNLLVLLQPSSEWDFASFTDLLEFHIKGKRSSRRKVIQLRQEDQLLITKHCWTAFVLSAWVVLHLNPDRLWQKFPCSAVMLMELLFLLPTVISLIMKIDVLRHISIYRSRLNANTYK